MTDPDLITDHRTAADVRAEALRGPWQAVLADQHGFVYDSVDDARENMPDPDDEITIAVVRGTALPNDRDGTTGCRLRMPGSLHCGDRAYELDDVYLDDPDDTTIGAEARYAQAQAMAAGLNEAQPTTPPGELSPAGKKPATDQIRVERDWLLAEADHDLRERFFSVRAEERRHALQQRQAGEV